MPTIKVAFDDLGIFFLDEDDDFQVTEVEVTDEQRVWIERTMKKFWAVQDFLINATRNGQN